jgi:biopolymer transport protein TolR
MAAGAINVASAGGRGKRGRRRPVMSDINVTPFVDVMLVLLIVFMVSAPLLTVGVPLDLPQSQAKALPQNNEPLKVSVTNDGQIFLQDEQKTPIQLDDLVPKLKAIIDARGGNTDETIYVRGDKKVDYGTMMRVMGRISGAGYHKVALITEVEQGGL